MVRDSLLAVSGQLDLRAGGPPVITEVRSDGTVGISSHKLVRPEDAFRRSLYLLQRRTYHPSLLSAFDQPVLNANCLRRPAAASVSQSLTLLNAPFVIERGYIHGATDDFGYRAVRDRVSIQDLHATLLRQLGLDHERVTFRHHGRNETLTDAEVSGARVVSGLIGKPT